MLRNNIYKIALSYNFVVYVIALLLGGVGLSWGTSSDVVITELTTMPSRHCTLPESETLRRFLGYTKLGHGDLEPKIDAIEKEILDFIQGHKHEPYVPELYLYLSKIFYKVSGIGKEKLNPVYADKQYYYLVKSADALHGKVAWYIYLHKNEMGYVPLESETNYLKNEAFYIDVYIPRMASVQPSTVYPYNELQYVLEGLCELKKTERKIDLDYRRIKEDGEMLSRNPQRGPIESPRTPEIDRYWRQLSEVVQDPELKKGIAMRFNNIGVTGAIVPKAYQPAATQTIASPYLDSTSAGAHPETAQNGDQKNTAPAWQRAGLWGLVIGLLVLLTGGWLWWRKYATKNQQG
jgi:hypothetical protein